MINASVAANAAQERNRACWLESAGNKLSAMIMDEARKGLRQMEIPYVKLIIGAENLGEAAQMLYLVEKILKEAGFTHKITQNGNLYISW